MSGQGSSQVTVRRATPADRDLLVRLAGRLANFDLPPWRTGDEIAAADARAMLAAVDAGTDGNEVLIAERKAGPVGCLHMIETTDFFGRRHAHLSVVAVAEAAEATGAGRELMAVAEEWARRRGLGLLTLNVFAANSRARRLYERAGFVPETLKYAKTVGR